MSKETAVRLRDSLSTDARSFLINLWVNAAFRVCGGAIKWVGTLILTPVAGIYKNQLETLSLSGC